MSPGLRNLTLAVHLTVSVGWVGALAAYLALDITTATSGDAQMLRAAYVAMDVTARYVILPLAVGSLVTGVVVALGTKWGIFRHYWVVISLVLTTIATIVLLIELGTIRSLAAIAVDASGSAVLRELPSTLVHSVGGMAVLLVILVLNIYKPAGMTAYGERKREQHARLG